jgi:hypothetical protein
MINAEQQRCKKHARILKADVDDKEFVVPQISMPVRRMLKILANLKPLVLYDRRVDVMNSFSDVTNQGSSH